MRTFVLTMFAMYAFLTFANAVNLVSGHEEKKRRVIAGISFVTDVCLCVWAGVLLWGVS